MNRNRNWGCSSTTIQGWPHQIADSFDLDSDPWENLSWSDLMIQKQILQILGPGMTSGPTAWVWLGPGIQLWTPKIKHAKWHKPKEVQDISVIWAFPRSFHFQGHFMMEINRGYRKRHPQRQLQPPQLNATEPKFTRSPHCCVLEAGWKKAGTTLNKIGHKIL